MEWILVLFMMIVIACWIGWGDKPDWIRRWYDNQVYHHAPKIIWTYWEEPDHVDPKKRLSEQALQSIRSWKGYEIIVLTKKTYQGYVTIPEEVRMHPALNPDYLRDLIKLWVLAERGGVWIDPEITLAKPLILFTRYGEFAAAIVPRTDPVVIDPSIMACNRGSIFMKKWRDEFSEIARFPNVDHYLQDRGHPIRDPIKNVIQVAQLNVCQTYPQESLILHTTNLAAQ